ncbi:MAG: nickel-dependent lactate racemase [bacterium]|nr:nickel-dependent lactate racemase [bacterium]
MEIKIPYGKATVNVSIPDNNIAGIIYPNKVEIADETEKIITALSHPINSKPFDKFLENAKNILFIVNDASRSTPTSKILDILFDKIQDKPVKFLVATGIHSATTEEELRIIFGKHYVDFQKQIYIHDAKKNEDLAYLGTSKSGTEIWLNKLCLEADKIIVIGSVEPHYFAGYTGGRKAFLPGIASFKTIEQNHKHALNPEAKILALENNPVNKDMVDALEFLGDKEIFSIQTVLDREHKIYSVTAGHINDSFYSAVEKANEVFCVKVKEKADIVVSVSGYPLDVDLYQSQKAIESGRLALKENGILILVSKCREGIGDKAFFEILASCKTPELVFEKLSKGYKLGYHKAAKIVELLRIAEIWAVTDLDENTLKSVFIKPFSSLQEAVDKAIEKKDENAKVLFLMDGSITVPVCSGL